MKTAMMKKNQILFFMLLIGVAFCLTNGFIFDGEVNAADDEAAILEGIFEFPRAEGAAYIQGTPEFQRVPDKIIGTPDFEKMQGLPTDSQDYSLGRKVGWFVVPQRNNPGRVWICTGFLVGPDLFMTNHHCLHDDARSPLA